LINKKYKMQQEMSKRNLLYFNLEKSNVYLTLSILAAKLNNILIIILNIGFSIFKRLNLLQEVLLNFFAA